MKRFPDPKRSAAAKKGWETRRRRAAEREARRKRRVRAAKKGWETRRAKSKRELELESEVKELKRKLRRLEIRNEVLEVIKARRERKERLVIVAKSDPESFRKGLAEQIDKKVASGRPFYESLADTWAEVNWIDGYEDIDDVRQAYAEEGTSPEAE